VRLQSSEGEPGADPIEAIVNQWRDALPTLDASPMLVVARLMRAAERCDALLRPLFAHAGLAGGDFDALAALRRAEPSHALTPGELGAAMLVTSGAVTKRIDRLERAGLVERARSSRDGRERVITLTPAGRELTDRLMQAHMENERTLLTALDPGERDALAALLGRFLASLELAEIRADGTGQARSRSGSTG
jgi:DNA-binding MarR family transcriptional regulator